MLDFIDKGSISAGALEVVEYCVNLGIVKDDSEKTFMPKEPLTREELCIIISVCGIEIKREAEGLISRRFFVYRFSCANPVQK